MGWSGEDGREEQNGMEWDRIGRIDGRTYRMGGEQAEDFGVDEDGSPDGGCQDPDADLCYNCSTCYSPHISR